MIDIARALSSDALPPGCVYTNCTCNEWCAYGPIAREYFGGWYVAMMVYASLSWTILLGFCFHQLHEKKDTKWNTAKTILTLNTVALLFVFADSLIGWAAWAREIDESAYVRDIRNILSIRVPQILWTTAAMVLVTFWAEMLKKARKFTKYKPSDGLNRKIFWAIVVLLGLEIPVHALALFDVNQELMWTIGNAILGGYIIVLSVAGLFYGLSLTSILKQMAVGKRTARSREMVTRFRRLSWMMSTLGLSMNAAVVWKVLMPNTMRYHMRFWYIVLTQEVLGSALLLYAVHKRGGAKKGHHSTYGSTRPTGKSFTSKGGSRMPQTPSQSMSLADSSGNADPSGVELQVKVYNDTPEPPRDHKRPSQTEAEFRKQSGMV